MVPFEVSAPGRVNLIGEHTDHAGGLALPAAIDRRTHVTVTRTAATIRLHSAGAGSIEVPADGSDAGSGWARYAAAVAAELDAAGRAPVGVEATVSSDVPAGAGLASSAALEVALASALCTAADFALEPLELVELCRRAEHRAVGVPCGVMDHMASVFGKRDHALLVDTASTTFAPVRLPDDVRLLVLDSGIRRTLAGSDYAKRREELLRGLAGATDEASLRRARHFHTENRRVREVAAALAADPPDLELAGRLMVQGHESLRTDFEVSTPELDTLVTEAITAGAYGARLTGAGFGGCVIALVDTDRAERIGAEAMASYGSNAKNAGSWMLCRADDGAREPAAADPTRPPLQ